MKLREALKKSGWEAFQNTQKEAWNVTDLLNEFHEGESPIWLDCECTVTESLIIDCDGDELTEVVAL